MRLDGSSTHAVQDAALRSNTGCSDTGVAQSVLERVTRWFARRGWKPFEYQLEAWRAYLAGESGLVHAPTGLGKTLAVWMGPVLEALMESPGRAVAEGGVSPASRTKLKSSGRRAIQPERVRVLWITPLRALAADTTESLIEPIVGLGLPWTVDSRTGDTSQSAKRKQRDRLPTALVTTPESLSLLLSYPDSREQLSTLRCVIVDEWHELLGTKRGIQTELGLARLRAWNPSLRTWGLSATLGNLDEASSVLLGGLTECGPTTDRGRARLIRGTASKSIEIKTIVPRDMARFPWAGHIGLRLLPDVIEQIKQAQTTLLFTNTRSQTEIWYRAIAQAQPDWLGSLAIHHGSIDHGIRARVEAMLKAGAVRCVVCTSSLDLGVDFSPVDQVIQIGSPKGVARLLQRAGRSGLQPGSVSRIVCVPTHAFELMEFAAVRDAISLQRIESREPLDRPFDVLVQHLVTVAMGGGFKEQDMLHEVKTTAAYARLTDQEWGWAMDFVRRGGRALVSYPQYARVVTASGEDAQHLQNGADSPTNPQQIAEQTSGSAIQNQNSVPATDRVRWVVASKKIASAHRMNIGTITSDGMMRVAYSTGRTLGNIEESFIARLKVGDRFVFSGRVLELLRVRDMTALVQRSRHARGIVPVWAGGRMPLSSQLAESVREKLEEARRGRYDSEEMKAIRPVLELQRLQSRIPEPHELLVERVSTRDGNHVIVFPFDGRLVHEGLAALCAYRVSTLAPISVHATATDYGFDLHTPPNSKDMLTLNADIIRRILSPENLVDDLLACLNTTELARRKFRDVARVAGLLQQGYPGQRKQARQLQASSQMFFEVFHEFDPANLLLTQARREVLDDQLEIRRLRRTLDRIRTMTITIVDTPMLSPLAFPVWAEVLRGVHASSETWSQRVARMSEQLDEKAASAENRNFAADLRKRRGYPRTGKADQAAGQNAHSINEEKAYRAVD